MLRNSIISILCFLFLSNTLVQPLLFWAQQNRIHQEVKVKLKQDIPFDELTIISFHTTSSIDWIKPNKEFRYQGELYDVVSKEEQEGQLTFWCINDEQEERLHERLNNYFTHHSDHSTQHSSSLFKKLATQDLIYCWSCLSLPLPSTDTKHLVCANPKVLNQDLPITLPPPQRVF